MLKPFRPLAAILGVAVLVACGDSATGVDASFNNCSVTAYTIGSTVTGTLSNSDCTLPDGIGEFVDYYGFSLSATTSVTIDMTSTFVDAFLILWNRQGQIVAQDDDGGVGTNARITTTLPAGNYVIGATSFGGGETGAYGLSSTTN